MTLVRSFDLYDPSVFALLDSVTRVREQPATPSLGRRSLCGSVWEGSPCLWPEARAGFPAAPLARPRPVHQPPRCVRGGKVCGGGGLGPGAWPLSAAVSRWALEPTVGYPVRVLVFVCPSGLICKVGVITCFIGLSWRLKELIVCGRVGAINVFALVKLESLLTFPVVGRGFCL